MHKLIAVNETYGFQGRHWPKDAEAHASDSELKESAKARNLPEGKTLFPPPHFRFADDKMNQAAAAALAEAKKKEKADK